jgi:glycosyltransferase involved in cell wall biosynthesis
LNLQRARVAVIIPTYNRGSRLAATVESVLAQGDALGQVIVVDDGSTDDTPERVKPLLDRVTYIRQDNAERGAARNRGAQAATEPYLCFLDSDDRFLPGHLESALATLAAHPTAAAAYSDVLVEDDAGQVIEVARGERLRGYRGGEPVSSLIVNFHNCHLGPGGVVYRRTAFEAVGGFREDRSLAGSEDFELNVRLLACGHYARTDKLTFGYRVHEGNTFGNVLQSTRCIRTAVQMITQNPDLQRFAPLFPRMRASAEIFLAAVHLGDDDLVRCRERLLDAIGHTREIVLTRRFVTLAARCLLGRHGNGVLRQVKRAVRSNWAQKLVSTRDVSENSALHQY